MVGEAILMHDFFFFFLIIQIEFGDEINEINIKRPTMVK